jgi:MFS transporter, DHA1 family, multidrug resistance protein
MREGMLIGLYSIVESSLGWRWIFWVMMIFAGSCSLLAIFFLPETYAPVILLKKAERLRKADPSGTKDLVAEHENQDWSIRSLVNRVLLRPIKMLMMEPILVLISIYLSIVYGILYALFEAFPIIFIRVRGFTPSQSGLIFIGIGIGTSLGSVLNALFSRHYPALIDKWRGFPPPEQRLFAGMLGGPALSIGAFWLGWTGNYASIPWYVPALSGILLGMGVSMIFMSFSVRFCISFYRSL